MPQKKQNKQWYGVQIQEKQAQMQRHEMCKTSQQKCINIKKRVALPKMIVLTIPKRKKNQMMMSICPLNREVAPARSCKTQHVQK